MTNREKCDAVVIAVMAVTIALVGAALSRSLSVAGNLSFGGNDFSWYVRLRVFDITFEVIALGALAYVLPRTRLTRVASRLAAVLAVVGIASEVGQWLLEGDTPFGKVEGGPIPGALAHLSVVLVCGAVIAMWFRSSDEVGAPDLA